MAIRTCLDCEPRLGADGRYASCRPFCIRVGNTQPQMQISAVVHGSTQAVDLTGYSAEAMMFYDTKLGATITDLTTDVSIASTSDGMTWPADGDSVYVIDSIEETWQNVSLIGADGLIRVERPDLVSSHLEDTPVRVIRDSGLVVDIVPITELDTFDNTNVLLSTRLDVRFSARAVSHRGYYYVTINLVDPDDNVITLPYLGSGYLVYVFN